MPSVFRVKWPGFAWVEAGLWFPVAVIVAGEFTPAWYQLPTAMAPRGAGILSFEPVLFWIVPAMVTAVPFLGLLIVVDRLLAAPKGLAILSVLATLLWAGAAAMLADKVRAFLPFAGDASWISFRGTLVLIVAAASSLVHCNIFRLGLRNTAGVYRKPADDWRMRLSRYQDEDYELSQRNPPRPRPAFDVTESVSRFFRRLTETVLFRVMIGCLIGVALFGVWLGYYYYTTTKDSPQASQPSQPAEVAALSPAVRPAVVPAVAITPQSIVREHDASGERVADGRFYFDVVVNGVKMPMTYDDDVPQVTIRAEDAVRLGISFARLDFETKIKTAKGLVEVAGITIQTMTIGSITYRRVPGFVAKQGALDENILGHSFLGRLAAYRLDGNRLTLIDRLGQSEAILASGNVKR